MGTSEATHSGNASHNDEVNVQAFSFEIYKHQLIQQRITGHACQIIYQHSVSVVSQVFLPAFGINKIERSPYQNATGITGDKMSIIGCTE